MQFGTDKASNHHNYLKFYDNVLSGLRKLDLKILEIGILDGASLRMWSAYFSKSTIVGADINPTTVRFGDDRRNCRNIGSIKFRRLEKLAIKHGPFDLIIEDGSHLWEHQITTFRELFPYVQPGGYYIVEDLQTNYGALADRYRGVSSISCVEYLKKAVDLRVGDEADKYRFSRRCILENLRPIYEYYVSQALLHNSTQRRQLWI